MAMPWWATYQNLSRPKFISDRSKQNARRVLSPHSWWNTKFDSILYLEIVVTYLNTLWDIDLSILPHSAPFMFLFSAVIGEEEIEALIEELSHDFSDGEHHDEEGE